MSEQLTPIPVLVTGVGGGGHGEQILKALRMAPTPYEIVGGDMSPYSSGLVAVDHPFLLPPANDPDYIPILIGLARKFGVKALFHGSEPELRKMSAEREALVNEGIFLPINPAPVIDICMDKVRTNEVLQQHGFYVPSFCRVRTVEEAMEFPHLPAVLKPSKGGGGSANIYLVQDREEMASCVQQLLTIYEEFIIQEYVGTPEEEYTVGVLLDMDGQLLNSIGVRRYILSALSNRIKVPNRSGKKELGSTLAISSGVSQGEIGRFPQVTKICEKVALAIGARGAINIQCRLVEEKVYIFEINPRFSGTTSLRAMVDYNEPDVLIRRHLLGEEIEPYFPYSSGVIMRGLVETLIERTEFPIAKDLV